MKKEKITKISKDDNKIYTNIEKEKKIAGWLLTFTGGFGLIASTYLLNNPEFISQLDLTGTAFIGGLSLASVITMINGAYQYGTATSADEPDKTNEEDFTPRNK